MTEYGSTMLRKVERVDRSGRKPRRYTQYVGVVKYKVANPDYAERPEGEDNRAANQKRAYIWKQKSTHFDPATVNTASKANAALAEWVNGLKQREEQAEQAEAEAVESGLSVTVPEYVDAHIEAMRGVLEPSTLKGYMTLSKRIRAEFEGVELRALSTDQVNKWLSSHAKRVSDGRQLSNSMRFKAFCLLNAACERAVDADIIPKNPCRKAEKPKRSEPRQNAMKDSSLKALQSAIEAMEPTAVVTAAGLGLYMGLREGEICALQWRDVDMQAETVWIHQSIGQGERGQATYLKQPKSKSGNRTLKLTPQALALIKRRMARVKGELSEIGVNPTAEAMAQLFVIGPVEGGYKNPTGLTREWRAMASALDLRGSKGELCTLHDLRHTYATKAASGPLSVKELQHHLGHSNANITMDIYAEVEKQQAENRAADRMGDVFASL